MAIFLDSGDISEIKRFKKMGVIRGVTTNPTILKKAGLTRGKSALRELEQAIAALISPLPLSVEVTGNKKKQMLDQAREFSAWADNINVKVPIHGPQGETFNLEVIHLLENRYDIRVNVTACMSAQQGLLAALAGATYVSLFGGRINNMGYDCVEEIARLRDLLDDNDLPSRIIVGSTREILNVSQWLGAGAHIVTATPALLEGMIYHPYTAETVRMFLGDCR